MQNVCVIGWLWELLVFMPLRGLEPGLAHGELWRVLAVYQGGMQTPIILEMFKLSGREEKLFHIGKTKSLGWCRWGDPP